MMGGLHGNWALLLVLYAGLLALAIASHIVWVNRKARVFWRSSHNTPYKVALIALLIMTPVVGFYATRIVRHLRPTQRRARPGIGDLTMPFMGAFTVLACAFLNTMRYSPDFRTWQAILGFVPGFLAFFGVMQLIVFMAASVFGLSQRGFLSSRTHLLSALMMLATSVMDLKFASF
jgi:hypothetical protein